MHINALSNSQGDEADNPSQTFDCKKSNALLNKVKKDITTFLFSSKGSVGDFVSTGNDTQKVTILLSVSGGKDSQVMLHCVHALLKHFPFTLSVVTVNHNIRNSKESKGDADLVHTYAVNSLGLSCSTITIEPKEIERIAKQRERGIEEAARHVRYTHIKKHAQSIGAKVVFFAHNKNDQLETLLQHFIQGSCAGISGFASSGIRQYLPFPLDEKNKDEPYELYLFRPLLKINRDDIDHYATIHDVPFREDSTNSELNYFRNRVRHTLVPVLNEFFTGWDTGVINGGEKAFQETLFIESIVNEYTWEVYNNEVRMSLDDFTKQGFPVKIRLLYKGIELTDYEGKIPYSMLKLCALGQRKVQGNGLELLYKNNYVIIKLIKQHKTPLLPFSIVVNEEGIYKTEYGTFVVKASVQKSELPADTERGDYYIGTFHLPLKIRSKNQGDTILTAQGTHKSLKKIFSEWRVDENHRTLLPLIEHDGDINCIWGSPYGYKNWYVKDTLNEQKQVYIHFNKE